MTAFCNLQDHACARTVCPLSVPSQEIHNAAALPVHHLLKPWLDTLSNLVPSYNSVATHMFALHLDIRFPCTLCSRNMLSTSSLSWLHAGDGVAAEDQGDSDSDDETDASELDGYAASNQPKREDKPALAQPRPAAQPDQGERLQLDRGGLILPEQADLILPEHCRLHRPVLGRPTNRLQAMHCQGPPPCALRRTVLSGRGQACCALQDMRHGLSKPVHWGLVLSARHASNCSCLELRGSRVRSSQTNPADSRLAQLQNCSAAAAVPGDSGGLWPGVDILACQHGLFCPVQPRMLAHLLGMHSF